VSIIDDERDYQPVIRRSERISLPMKSSTSSQHISNSFLTNQQQKPSNDEEISTYSFRHITKKLQHAKSYGELYQPHAPLPLPPMIKINSDENDIKYRQKYSSDSPQSLTSVKTRTSVPTTTVVPIITRPTINSSDETFNSSSSQKIPLWKRVKKMIVPTKRNKEQQNLSLKNSTLQPDELSTNDTSKTFFHMTFDHRIFTL
jgi:hypothetical protein